MTVKRLLGWAAGTLRSVLIKLRINSGFLVTGRWIAASAELRLGHRTTFVLGRNTTVKGHVRIIIDDHGGLVVGRDSVIERGGEITAVGGARVSIGDHTHIGSFCNIRSDLRISIGSHCYIAQFVSIVDGGYEYADRTLSITGDRYICKESSIGDNVWLGVGAVILPGVTVGNGAVIGAGAIVTRDVPPYAVAAGNPARVLKYRK